MAQFIHLTDERLSRKIERGGIKPGEVWDSAEKYVFATPVLENFMVSHQWLRELKRRGIRTIAAVQFRIPDNEVVWIGRFGKEALATTAAGAFQIFRQHEFGNGPPGDDSEEDPTRGVEARVCPDSARRLALLSGCERKETVRVSGLPARRDQIEEAERGLRGRIALPANPPLRSCLTMCANGAPPSIFDEGS